jgi:hypothetical protein
MHVAELVPRMLTVAEELAAEVRQGIRSPHKAGGGSARMRSVPGAPAPINLTAFDCLEWADRDIRKILNRVAEAPHERGIKEVIKALADLPEKQAERISPELHWHHGTMVRHLVIVRGGKLRLCPDCQYTALVPESEVPASRRRPSTMVCTNSPSCDVNGAMRVFRLGDAGQLNAAVRVKSGAGLNTLVSVNTLAAATGISRSTIYRTIQQHGIAPADHLNKQTGLYRVGDLMRVLPPGTGREGSS